MQVSTISRLARDFIFSIAVTTLTLFPSVLGFCSVANAQSLSWSTPSSLLVQISGVPGRESPGAAVFNAQMYIAYTTTQVVDSQGDKSVYIGTFNSGFTQVPQVGSVANPSMVAFNGKLYLATNDALGSANIISFDGSNWGVNSVIGGLGIGSVIYSPSLATDGTYLYVGLISEARNMILCKSSDGTNFSCQNFSSLFPSDSLGYNPGLAVYNGVLYAGWVTNGNSHDMYYYTSPDQGVTWSRSTSLTGSQSSCAPHLAVHNSVLWYDVRTNDGAHKFSQRYTTNGFSWASGADAHLAMEGEPVIVDGESGGGLPPGEGQYLYLFFTSNDGTNTLYLSEAQ